MTRRLVRNVAAMWGLRGRHLGALRRHLDARRLTCQAYSQIMRFVVVRGDRCSSGDGDDRQF